MTKQVFIPTFGTKNISDHFYSYIKYNLTYAGEIVDKDAKPIEPAPKIPTPEELAAQLTTTTQELKTTQKPETTQDSKTTQEPKMSDPTDPTVKTTQSMNTKPATTTSSANNLIPFSLFIIFYSVNTFIGVFDKYQ